MSLDSINERVAERIADDQAYAMEQAAIAALAELVLRRPGRVMTLPGIRGEDDPNKQHVLSGLIKRCVAIESGDRRYTIVEFIDGSTWKTSLDADRIYRELKRQEEKHERK